MRSQRTERGEGQAEVGKDRKARPLWERARPTKSWQKRVYIYIDIYAYKELTAQLGQSALESAAKSAKWREEGWDEGELPQNWRVSVNNAFIAFFCNCVRACVCVSLQPPKAVGSFADGLVESAAKDEHSSLLHEWAWEASQGQGTARGCPQAGNLLLHLPVARCQLQVASLKLPAHAQHKILIDDWMEWKATTTDECNSCLMIKANGKNEIISSFSLRF